MAVQELKTAEVLERVMEVSKYDLDWLNETVSQIAGNLRCIGADQNDLDELQKITNDITSNLQTINDDETDVDGLRHRTCEIVGNLTAIAGNADEVRLRDLEEVTGQVLTNLREIAELLDRDDVAAAIRKATK